MLISLATSERTASVCVNSEDSLLANVDSDQWMQKFADDRAIGKSTALVSMIQFAMQEAGATADSVSAIALTNGPGAFTGLRVGVVAARMLCYAWKLPVVVVNSLEVAADKLIRARGLKPGTTVWAITDAQRRQVFAAKFEMASGGSHEVVVPQGLFTRESLVAELRRGDHVTGSGAHAFADQIEAVTGVELAEKQISSCDALGVAALAGPRLAARDFDDLMSIEPIYFRPSAAEEVRMARLAKTSDKN